MSNHITIELCAEDRARLDRLAEAMEAHTAQVERILNERVEPDQVDGQMQIEFDDVQAKLAETLAKAEEQAEAKINATEEAQADTPTTTPPAEEEPTVIENTEPVATPKVGRAELKAKVIQLCAKSLKAKEQTRDIVRSYAQTVTDVPEDKINECYAKLAALEQSLEG